MKITCQKCDFSKEIPDDKIPDGMEIATCPMCKHKFPFREPVEPNFGFAKEESSNLSHEFATNLSDTEKPLRTDAEAKNVSISLNNSDSANAMPLTEAQDNKNHNINDNTSYAGFWKRLGAGVIDVALVTVVQFVMGFTLGLLGIVGADTPEVFWHLFGIASTWIYFAAMESSYYQATLGKMALRIIVTDKNGERTSFARATGRYFGKFISALLIFAGFIMIAFTKKKQGLHDIMSECLVVNK